MKMTFQEVFDKVATHLLTQKKKSIGEDGCSYRGEDNTSCAVGCLIPDSKYTPEIEGAGVQGLYTENQTNSLIRLRKILGEVLNWDFDKENTIFLRELQYIHDRKDVEYWKDSLVGFAEKWDLNKSVLVKFNK